MSAVPAGQTRNAGCDGTNGHRQHDRGDASPFLYTNEGSDRLVALEADGTEKACAFSQPERSAAFAAINAFVLDDRYPCAGAKSAMNLGACRIGFYAPLGSRRASENCARDAAWFAQHASQIDGHFATLIALFHGPAPASERDFSVAFWRQLSAMAARDKRHYDWDPDVSSDPASPDFAMSFGGKAFFLVGMHPSSSRKARRFPLTAIVFNLHAQFETLREGNIYHRMRDTIRKRDECLQGSSNPMLADFGEGSAAAQYDGMRHDDDWLPPIRHDSGCPFASRARKIKDPS